MIPSAKEKTGSEQEWTYSRFGHVEIRCNCGCKRSSYIQVDFEVDFFFRLIGVDPSTVEPEDTGDIPEYYTEELHNCIETGEEEE